MSRPAILAEHFPHSGVGDALRDHREDRERLLASLTESLRSDPRVLAARLWGSFGRGEADDLSDLDPWIVVPDEAVGEMGRVLRQYAERTGNFITGGESTQNAPPNGGFFSSLHEGRQGLLHVDCYWQAMSAAETMPQTTVLFERRHESVAADYPQPLTHGASANLTADGKRIVDGIDFSWLMLSIAAKTLARFPDSDMALILYPKPGFDEAAKLLGREAVAASADWSAPTHPMEKVERLRHLVKKTDELTQAAIEKGFNVAPRRIYCMTRYLELVAGILTVERGIAG